jgi:hypothetical protein
MRTPDFSDEQLLAGLRAAADELGEPLTASAYDSWQRGRDDAASAALLIRRLGGWVEACTRAGLSTNKTRSTSRRWSDEEVVAVVGAYLAAPGSSGTFAGYAAWAREQPGVPSGSTLRQRFPRWAELKERARNGS